MAHVLQPANAHARRAEGRQDSMSLRAEGVAETWAKVRQHGGEHDTMADIPAGQIDLEPLAGADTERRAVRCYLAREHFGAVGYQQ